MVIFSHRRIVLWKQNSDRTTSTDSHLKKKYIKIACYSTFILFKLWLSCHTLNVWQIPCLYRQRHIFFSQTFPNSASFFVFSSTESLFLILKNIGLKWQIISFMIIVLPLCGFLSSFFLFFFFFYMPTFVHFLENLSNID